MLVAVEFSLWSLALRVATQFHFQELTNVNTTQQDNIMIKDRSFDPNIILEKHIPTQGCDSEAAAPLGVIKNATVGKEMCRNPQFKSLCGPFCESCFCHSLCELVRDNKILLPRWVVRVAPAKILSPMDINQTSFMHNAWPINQK